MKLLFALIAFFSALLFLLLGGVLIAAVINPFTLGLLFDFLFRISQIPNFSFFAVTLGILFILTAFLILYLLEKNYRREKTIALNGKNGKITMAVSVIEDLIKRSVENLLDIKEINSKILLKKKSIKIISKITLFSTANIPKITDETQKIIKAQIEEALNIKEDVDVEIYVSKIVEKSDKERIREKKELAKQISI